MKKRTKIVWIIACIGVLLGLAAGIVFAQFMRTDSPHAVTEAGGVFMEWVEEPSRELLVYQIRNSSGNPVYGSYYRLEFQFLGCWYRLMYRAGATYDLGGIVVGERTDTVQCREKPTQLYAFLPPGNYRIVQRFYTVEDHVLYENRDKYFDLYLEFELD
ncbi:MAG: hypothetical protein E7604_06940 [Ruminococcaceae bacterium]|nr:hypothetical protein [Oscillospiraceae bacterium]